MKYMHLLKERPDGFDDPLLVDLYKASELAAMTVNRRQNYDKVMTNEIDKMCEISFARKEGEAKGKAEMAKALKELGVPADKISRASGLTPEEIERM